MPDSCFQAEICLGVGKIWWEVANFCLVGGVGKTKLCVSVLQNPAAELFQGEPLRT